MEQQCSLCSEYRARSSRSQRPIVATSTFSTVLCGRSRTFSTQQRNPTHTFISVPVWPRLAYFAALCKSPAAEEARMIIPRTYNNQALVGEHTVQLILNIKLVFVPAWFLCAKLFHCFFPFSPERSNSLLTVSQETGTKIGWQHHNERK